MIVRVQKESEFTKGHFYIQHHILYYGAAAVAEVSYEYNWKKFDIKLPNETETDMTDIIKSIFSDVKNYILTIIGIGDVPDIFIFRYLSHCQPNKKFSKDKFLIEIIRGNIISLYKDDDEDEDEENIKMIW